MSSDGQIQILSPIQNDTGAYISYNYGISWSLIAQSSSPNVAGITWHYAFVSGDGKYVNLFQGSASTSWAQSIATPLTLAKTNVSYIPATSADWPTALKPTTLGEGLDIIAKYLKLTGSTTWANLI